MMAGPDRTSAIGSEAKTTIQESNRFITHHLLARTGDHSGKHSTGPEP